MAATPEKKVKTAVGKLLARYGVYFFYPVATGMGRAGIPDIIGCFKGHFIAIECKAGKNTTTALQERELYNIQSAGGIAIVINESNIVDLEEILNESTSTTSAPASDNT
jgi:hypothetical protein